MATPFIVQMSVNDHIHKTLRYLCWYRAVYCLMLHCETFLGMFLGLPYALLCGLVSSACRL